MSYNGSHWSLASITIRGLRLYPTSNVPTGAVASIEEHPIDLLRRLRYRVTVNTDNRLMSGVNLTNEYEHASRHLGFTFDELCEIALNGFASAFISWEDRERMISDAMREMDKLRREVSG